MDQSSPCFVILTSPENTLFSTFTGGEPLESLFRDYLFTTWYIFGFRYEKYLLY